MSPLAVGSLPNVSVAHPLAVLRTDQIHPGGRYSISLVDQSGTVVATVQAATRSPIPFSPGSQPTLLPLTSASNSRVYYLDGDSTLRFLAPDRTMGTVGTLPGSATAQATFAVSPDDSQIAVAVLDYSASPVGLRIYVEDLASRARHHDVSIAPAVYAWPVGWVNGDLVLAIGSPVDPDPGLPPSNPYAAISYQVVDPQTGNVVAALGGTGCRVSGPLSTAGTVTNCQGFLTQAVVDWHGYSTRFPGGVACAALSPSGKGIAGCNTDIIVIERPDGSIVSAPGSAPLPPGLGWLDDTHLIYGCTGEAGCLARIFDVLTATVTTVSGTEPPIQFVGTVPGDLSGQTSQTQ